ncbi:hypothetical protein [Chryseobacterium sp. VD8]|uniref:hypothetical protein n=1 Tax=Chryseobacterium sp. VD8 TaxID=3081254 RepID=UPI00301A5EDA
MADTYFGGKPVIKSGNYEVYTDETDPIKETVIEEVIIYKSFDAVFGDIKIKLFASKDGVFLLQRYREMTEPDDKTIILFLEIDDGYNLHTVMRIRAGKDITDSKKLPFANILNLTREHSINVSPDDLKKLLEKGAIANKKTFWTWLLKIIKAPISDVYSFFSSKLYNGAADFFENTIAKNIQSIKVSENGWNPNPKEGEFSPALIPEKIWQIMKPYYEHKATDDPNLNFLGGEKTVNSVFNSFFEMLDSHKDKVTTILKSMKPYLPASIYKMFLDTARNFLGGISDLKKMLRESIPRLQSIIYKSFTIANAMLCGIYNSLVDIIAGIFSIIGFIFRFLAIQEEFKDDPSLMADFFLEYMEGVFEGVMKFDAVDFFFEMISFQAKTALNLYRWITEKAPDITLEQVFYYYGYIVGIIIDIVVETLLTGGVAAVAKLFEGVAAFMRNPMEKLAQGIAKSVKFGKDLLAAVLEFMRMIVKKFKEGSKALFEELKLWMDEIFGVGKKVEDFALTDKQRRIKELREEKARKLEKLKERRDPVKGKRIKQHEDFVKKWKAKGRSIKALTTTEIANALKGFTEQGNKIAKLIEEEKVFIHILEDDEYIKFCIEEYGDTLEEAVNTHAFADGIDMYFRASRKPDVFLSELIHEGTHAKEANEIIEMLKSGKTEAEIMKIMGNNWSSEKRAFFHEHAWQEATGMDKDFETIEEMLENIFTNYDEY